jgi:hypothetical protein
MLWCRCKLISLFHEVKKFKNSRFH